MFLNTFVCPACKATSELPGLDQRFKCPKCDTALQSNSIIAFIAAMAIGGLPTAFVGEVGASVAVIAIIGSIAATIGLWRMFLNIQIHNAE